MANVLGFAKLGCCAAACLFSLLAVALPYWQIVVSVQYYGGLWRFCAKTSRLETCGDLLNALPDEDKDSLRATQGMVLLGFFCITGALVVVALSLFVLKDQKMLGFIGGGLAIAGGLFLMFGMAIYADKFKNDNSDYSAGFVFDILAWLVSWAAGGLIIFAASQGNSDVGSS